ncbi:hypothetical protein ZWY2020_054869 [Hordeum vulgare]|nr:hypothetical protein ZWY2020_054869 [Hordeum vulgare]
MSCDATCMRINSTGPEVSYVWSLMMQCVCVWQADDGRVDEPGEDAGAGGRGGEPQAAVDIPGGADAGRVCGAGVYKLVKLRDVNGETPRPQRSFRR